MCVAVPLFNIDNDRFTYLISENCEISWSISRSFVGAAVIRRRKQNRLYRCISTPITMSQSPCCSCWIGVKTKRIWAIITLCHPPGTMICPGALNVMPMPLSAAITQAQVLQTLYNLLEVEHLARLFCRASTTTALWIISQLFSAGLKQPSPLVSLSNGLKLEVAM